MTIERAHTSDLPEVLTLLERHHLPLDGVSEHVASMVVARDHGKVAGVAATELYADSALLRSVAVDPLLQGRGIGHQLTEAVLGIAREHDLNTIFLLTTTAEDFFRRFGFEQISRSDVPATVQASVEFQSACPASAIVMRKRLVEER
jgi:amino-acid N-acetyltransferase